MNLYKQRYLCKECLKTWSARTDIVEEGHTLSLQLKRSVLYMAREEIKMGPDYPIPLSLILFKDLIGKRSIAFMRNSKTMTSIGQLMISFGSR